MKRLTPCTRNLLIWSTLLVSLLVMSSVSRALEVGEPAPDFSLPSTMGGEVGLSQFRGKQIVLIEFYTNDFVPT